MYFSELEKRLYIKPYNNSVSQRLRRQNLNKTQIAPQSCTLMIDYGKNISKQNYSSKVFLNISRGHLQGGVHLLSLNPGQFPLRLLKEGCLEQRMRTAREKERLTPGLVLQAVIHFASTRLWRGWWTPKSFPQQLKWDFKWIWGSSLTGCAEGINNLSGLVFWLAEIIRCPWNYSLQMQASAQPQHGGALLLPVFSVVTQNHVQTKMKLSGAPGH